MESAAKRPKVDGQEAAATTNADTSNQAATDFFPLEHLPAEIFPSITASLSHQDIVHLSEVSSAFLWLSEDNTWSSSVWGQLLRSDFLVADVAGFQMFPRHVYIQMRRAKWNPAGIPWPGCSPKDVKHDAYIRSFCEVNHIKPFWMQHMGHTNQRTRRVAAEVKPNKKAFFKSAGFHCMEVNRLQIEGEAHIRFPGYYRVEWRLLLQSYTLKTPTFISRVVAPNSPQRSESVYEQKFSWDLNEPNTESFYKWEWDAGEYEPQRGPDQALPVGDFFEVIVGKIRVKEANSKVLFAMVEPGLDWKYDFFLDYVALIPITKDQYDSLEIVSPNRDLPPLPVPAPAQQAGAGAQAAQQQQHQVQQQGAGVPQGGGAGAVPGPQGIAAPPPNAPLPPAVPAQ